MIDPSRGGALASLSVGDRELLLSPNGRDAPFPHWGSFLMAPWVGHLADGRLTFRGLTHRLEPNWGRHAVHGLVALGAWDVEDASDTTAVLSRRLDGAWPFGGFVRQDVALDEAGITLVAEVRAEASAMPAALGWHPWFRRGAAGDTVIRVTASQLLGHDGELPTGRIEPVAGPTDLRDGPGLGDRRIDAVFVDAVSPALLVADGFELRVRFDPRIRTVVAYTPAEAVCLEPWSAWPDAHRLAVEGCDTGLVELEPGQALRRWTRWEWAMAAPDRSDPGAT